MKSVLLLLLSFDGSFYQIKLVLLTISLILIALFLIESISAVFPLRHIPSASPGPRYLAYTIASLRAAFHSRELVNSAYTTYSKNNKAFLFTNIFWRTEVMLPPTQIKEMLAFPDKVLSCQKALEDNLQAEWTLLGLLDSHTAVNQWHTLPVKALSALTSRNVDKMMEETELGFDAYWGTGGENEWKAVDVMNTMLKIATRVGNRFVFGSELCRNEQFVIATATFTRQALVGAILIRVFPKFLRPIFGRLIGWPNLKNYKTFNTFAKPLIEQKIVELVAKFELGGKSSALPKTDDILQWHAEYAHTQADPEEFTADRISKRLMVFNTAAVVSTAAALTHLITDLYTMPEAASVCEELREEISRVLKEEKGVLSMRGLNRMVKLDSAVKESLRLSSNGTGICARVVVKKEGVKLEDGLYLPHGSTVSVPQWAPHHDASLYPDPDTYHPLRFYQRRLDALVGTNGEQDTESLVSTTVENLTWGLGRHACPGRFFVGAEMKLILAHCLMHYDIEPATKLPTQMWFGTVYIPSDAPFRVRRRSNP